VEYVMEVAGLCLLIGTVIILFAFAATKIPRLLYLMASLVFPSFRLRKEAYKKAREVGIQTCKKLYPDEPVLSASVSDDEAGRHVVTVFYGNRDATSGHYKLPPWKSYLIVAVQKDTYLDEVTEGDQERYRPVIR
jgi:hypothetical protein